MVFYFTGTGNCLHVARELAAAESVTGEPGVDGIAAAEPVSIPQEMRREGDLAYRADAIGIVYPIYGHMMPTMVKQFIERATFNTPYLYFAPTYGCRHANASELCEQDARAAGLDPAYIRTLIMTDNWLPNFDMNEQAELLPGKQVDEHIEEIKADVAARRRWIEPVTDEDRAAHEGFMARGLRFEAEALGDFLRIDADACIGCGLCTRVCPAGCIALEDGKARRDALAGFGCNACLGCIHACPAHAISLPMGEVNPEARFRNERVTLRDLQRANA